jgi:hypothetical protein
MTPSHIYIEKAKFEIQKMTDCEIQKQTLKNKLTGH